MIIDKENLLKSLEATTIDNEKYVFMPAKVEGFTLLCKNEKSSQYLNSSYDPQKAAEQFAEAVYGDEDSIILYGLGLGYHVKALKSRLKEGQTLYVFESNLQTTKIAFEKMDILDTLESKNVVFYCTNHLGVLARSMDAIIGQTGARLNLYMPSVNIIPKESEKLKDVLNEYKATIAMGKVFGESMTENSRFNKAQNYRNGAELLKGAFENMPAILVAAGASLDLNISDLKKCQNKALIVSVARMAKRLDAEGIRPDFLVGSDAGNWYPYHLGGLESDVPLFLLSTGDKGAEKYKGEKLIVFEKEAALREGIEDFIEVGGSVATAALSLCTLMGANPIVLIGQDLCYCFDKTHSFGGKTPNKPMKGGKFVLANDGNEYSTSGSLYIFLKWIERYISRNRNVNYYNATALGAVIEGAENVDIIKFFEHYSDIKSSINIIKKNKNLL